MRVKKAELFPVSVNNNKTAIIFVHGLHGHPEDTWRKDKKFDSLPKLIGSDIDLTDVDVYSFGYRSNFSPFLYDFTEISKVLHTEIRARLSEENIIFVAHSMGGLIVQQYIVDQYDEINSQAISQVKGIVYLAVPFAGSTVAIWAAKVLFAHNQVRTLIEKNPNLVRLRENWVKYVFRGGNEELPDKLQHKFPQIALYGAKDKIVPKASSSLFHIGAEICAVDAGHTAICKVSNTSTEYRLIKKFITNVMTAGKKAMIVHVHGWNRQSYAEEAHCSLDLTMHFQISGSTRILPRQETWRDEIAPSVEFIGKEWSDKWSNQGGIIRLYGKICLTAGLLLGTKLSFTKGVKLEAEHYGQIWAADKSESRYNPHARNLPGNPTDSSRAVLVLSVSKDIQNEVQQYLVSANMEYKKMLNLLPPNGAGQNSIENAKQAVAYAIAVKGHVEQLKNEGVKEILLFLNTPLSVAYFVGHRLTAACAIQTFEYNSGTYVPSCSL